MGLSHCGKSLPYWIIVPPMGGSTPRGVGALQPRLGCSFMYLVFLATCVVWDLGHYLLPNGQLARGRTRLPMQFIHLKIQLQQFFFSCLWSNQLDGRGTRLRVQLGHVLPVALVDGLFCLLLPFYSSMPEHHMQNHKTMRAVCRSTALELQEQLHIHGPLQLSDQPMLFRRPFLCHLEFLSFTNVPGYHQSVVTTGK